MDETDNRMVRYDLWCDKCKHKTINENDEPCEECLSNPINTHTEKPVKFEEK